MSTRIHWGGENGHRSCTHCKTAAHREISAAEFLKLQNLCRICELAAQKEQRKQIKSPKSLPAPQWPEPRPIAEAPQEAVLGWCPHHGQWVTCYPWHKDYWNGIDGECHKITHFLPLPPKPEVRK